MIAVADPRRALVLAYAAREKRPALAALWGLDEAMAVIAPHVREPMAGLIRLQWWSDALAALDQSPPTPEPVLRALAEAVLPLGISGSELAALADGWEAIVTHETLDDAAVEQHARARGEALFLLAGRVLGAGPEDPVAAGGMGWALAELPRRAKIAHAAGARARAAELLGAASRERWSRAGRPLGALVHLSRLEQNSGGPVPTHVVRALYHVATGR